MELREIKPFIERIKQEDITFDSHFYKRTQQRPISESIARSFLSQPNKIEKIEQGKSKNRFKLWFKMSNKYSLVLIIEFDTSKGLKVISAWNSSRRWQN
ncbi:hypothetical protein COU61_04055, partial [Candidatus Pacearchaeota archaeon CG10_big_fil_rev_8_21_14_0_10_35_13]